jgi:hypothetical protein
MSEFENIKTGFAKAKLDVVKRTRPGGMGVGAKRAFFCEITKAKGKPAFSIWPGAETNTVQVLDTDAAYRQLVLLVKEEAGTIKMREYDWKTRKYTINTIRVPASKRKFLLGFDERDLFMAQLPASKPVTTVKQAHEALRNPALPKERKTKIQRQGEWFFRPVTNEEAQIIWNNENIIEHNARINKKVLRGKPHTAEEYLEIGTSIDPVSRAIIPGSMFARGRISHSDHASLNLRTWHRVYSNAEDRTANARWID